MVQWLGKGSKILSDDGWWKRAPRSESFSLFMDAVRDGDDEPAVKLHDEATPQQAVNFTQGMV